MNAWTELTIVTSVHRYGKYLPEWTKGILSQTVRPGLVCIFSHGTTDDRIAAEHALKQFKANAIVARHIHHDALLDYGTARNRAVEMANSEWVVHFDADDILMAHAVSDFRSLASDADVIQAGYERSGAIATGPARRARIYARADGLGALALSSICSGNSPFRKSLWDRSPYRTDMFGAWDTALWIGFARLGARFRPTTRAAFYYRQHQDSVFNNRRRVNGWPRAHTQAMLKSLRRNYDGVDVIIPTSARMSAERARNLVRVREHYRVHHPEWNFIEGTSNSPEWVKGHAIEQALGSARGEIIVIADADCIVDPASLRASVAAVQAGAAWSMPHTMVHRANEALTKVICSQPASALPMIPAEVQCDRPPHESAPGGGIVVVRRMLYDSVGGFPQSFKGWGSEDKAFALLCNTLIGPCVQGNGVIVHLWHPPQQVKPQPQQNLGLLTKMGHAAQHGKDALIALTSSFPNGSTRPHQRSGKSVTPGMYHRPAVREIKQFDQRAISTRRERLQEARRRMK
jgi:hypothetical protein